MYQDHLSPEFRAIPTHRPGGVSKVDLKAAHGSDDGDDGLDGVAVDHSLVLLTLLLRVPSLVDDPEETPPSTQCTSYIQQLNKKLTSRKAFFNHIH